MTGSLHPVLEDQLNAALLAVQPFSATRRDATLPDIRNKVFAVIGMRRAGKTTFLRQLQADLRKELPPERAIYLSFDDDRLAALGVEQLSALLEAYYRRLPELRGKETVHWFLDEIQLVPGWERFVRRVLDSERIRMTVSGSSARMLSREVHTSLRGRGWETVIRPFSFREYLRHRDLEPDTPPQRWTPAVRSRIEKHFNGYLKEGGFPEAQGLDEALRVELLQGYVDTVLFRDVIERYGVSQVTALRWIVRHALRNPARAFSVHRMHQDLKSQGHSVAKDSVHELLGHLLDAFLLSAVPLDTESLRQLNANPRKLYPADPGLIHAFDRSGRANLGHALETAVFNQLERRRAEVAYVRLQREHEVDFIARYPTGEVELLQVCADPSEPAARERELRSLRAARAAHPRAKALLLVLHREHLFDAGDGIEVRAAYDWLLGDDEQD